MTPRVLHGLKELSRHLQGERAQLAAAPLLVVTSENSQSDAAQHVLHTAAQQLGLRTVAASIVDAYPTKDTIQTTLELQKRTGAGSILAVGDANAMDLAKAVVCFSQHEEPLILVPTTFNAILMSSASRGLVWDSHEEALVPTGSVTSDERTIALLEQDRVDTHGALDAALTARILEQYRGLLPSDVLVERALDEVDSVVPDIAYALLEEGEALSFGLEGNQRRSLPLAIATSLLPIFPQSSLIGVMASLVMPRLLTTEPADTLMEMIKTNQRAWNCIDEPDSEMRSALEAFETAQQMAEEMK